MRKFKIVAALLAALVLLAACAAGQDGPEEAAAGADWRTYGWVSGAGTLTLEGASTEVLVCVFDDCVRLYLDDDTQTLAAEAEYPQKIENARTQFESLSLDDQNGDGNSDMRLVLTAPDGVKQELVWIWDTQDAAFLYQPNAQPKH